MVTRGRDYRWFDKVLIVTLAIVTVRSPSTLECDTDVYKSVLTCFASLQTCSFSLLCRDRDLDCTAEQGSGSLTTSM